MPDQHVGQPSLPVPLAYDDAMQDNENNNDIAPELERYLALCQRVYERMIETGKWPWSDSPDFGDVVESEDNHNDI